MATQSFLEHPADCLGVKSAGKPHEGISASYAREIRADLARSEREGASGSKLSPLCIVSAFTERKLNTERVSPRSMVVVQHGYDLDVYEEAALIWNQLCSFA